MQRVGWERVLALRAHRQGLARRVGAGEALDVVSRLCGLHAQVASSAQLTLAARVRDAPDTAAMLWDDGTLVKTWAQRGTLHLLRADEHGRYCAAMQTLRPRDEQPSWLRHHGLTAESAGALAGAIRDVLADGAARTREQLAEDVAASAGQPALAEKLLGGFGDLLKPAAFRGDIRFGPPDGRFVRFVAGGVAPEDPDGALAGLARGFLRVYGPTTRERFARWLGDKSPAHAGRALRGLGDELCEVEVDGQARMLLAADEDVLVAAEPTGALRLLPAFDQHVVATERDVDAVLAPERRAQIYRTAGWLTPVVLHGDRIAGTWSHELDDDALTVSVDAWGALPAEALADEADELARALGARDVTLRAA